MSLKEKNASLRLIYAEGFREMTSNAITKG